MRIPKHPDHRLQKKIRLWLECLGIQVYCSRREVISYTFPYQIVWLVVLEVIILSTIAGIIGFATGVGLDLYLMNFGIDISNGTAEPVAIMGAYLEPRVFAVIKEDLFFTPVVSLFSTPVNTR